MPEDNTGTDGLPATPPSPVDTSGVPEGGVPPEVTPPVVTAPDPQKQDGPPPDHPRFNEIYAKMKDFERKAHEQDTTIDALREHNKSLSASIDTVTDQFSDASRPDPTEDPEAFATWMEAKVTRDVKRGMEANQQTQAPAPAPVTAPTSDLDPIRESQIVAMETIHSDYNDIINNVQDDIKNDAVLRNQIYSSPNPPKAAYDYGVRKKEAHAQSQAQTQTQAYVEGGGVGGAPVTQTQASPAQVDMANKLGIPIDRYMKQATYINGRNS